MAPTHPIFVDIKRGRFRAVKQRVLADPTVLEERCVHKNTPLIYACCKLKPDIALWLIEHRGQHDVDTRGEKGNTALHHACDRGAASVVQALVAAGANPSRQNRHAFSTPLLLASANGHADTVAFLLALPAVKATINAVNTQDETALSIASGLGRHRAVQLLLDAGADPTLPAGPNSPLYQATHKGHIAIMDLLGPAIDERDRARAPLDTIFFDIRRGDLEAVQQRVLADEGVVEERGIDWQTPLICAAEKEQPAIALWLIEHCGQHDVNTHDEDSWTALHYACQRGPLSVVQALVNAGANPALRDNFGATPLMAASANGHADIVAFLLRLPAAKATIDTVNYGWDTALTFASTKGHASIVRLLLAAGAKPTVPTGDKSPLKRTIRNGHATVVQLLLDAGVDPTFPAGDRSPLNIAASEGQTHIVDLLQHAIAERAQQQRQQRSGGKWQMAGVLWPVGMVLDVLLAVRPATVSAVRV